MKLYYIVNVMMDFSSVILKKVIFAKVFKGFTYIFRFFFVFDLLLSHLD